MNVDFTDWDDLLCLQISFNAFHVILFNVRRMGLIFLIYLFIFFLGIC